MKRGDPTDRAGFTLLELMIVITIIVFLACLAMPSMSRILKGSQVTIGSEILSTQFAFARQTALTKNRIVEVRFYQYVDPSIPGSPSSFRAVQAFQYDEANQTAMPLAKMQRLPGSLIMDARATYSTLLADVARLKTWTPSSDPQVVLPGVSSYTAYCVRFRPDGTTDLVKTANWFITVREETDTGSPAKNYVTLQIDPVNGSLKTYRPG